MQTVIDIPTPAVTGGQEKPAPPAYRPNDAGPNKEELFKRVSEEHYHGGTNNKPPATLLTIRCWCGRKSRMCCHYTQCTPT